MIRLAIAALQLAAAPGEDLPKTVDIPRFESGIVVDGVLDEAEWERAAVLRDFWQYVPVDGRRAADSTVVLVWYSPTRIHFGVTAYGRAASVRATLADRDKISSDDQIQILLDTFDDQRQAYLFAVNPLGVQADGILRDAARRGSSAFTSGSAAAYTVDFNPDFVFESAGRRTEAGYVVEVSIPFKTLRYQTGNVQDWGLNIIRQAQASGYEDTWSPVRQASASFLSQGGRLQGLTDLRRGLVLDLNPEATSTIEGSSNGTRWEYGGGQPEIGGNIRWGVTNNLTLNGTVNPDFSQVEADVAQVQYDPRQALSFPEKRPFFLDGIELFSMPNQLVYTRRIVNPVAAAKLTGKLSGTNVALLSAADDRSLSATGTDNPVFNLLRLRRDLGGQSTLGLGYTDRIDGDDYNRVGAVDGRVVFGGVNSVTFQAAASFDRRGGTSRSGPLWHAVFNRSGRRFGLTYTMRGYHPDFRAGSGFIGRVGIVQANASPTLTFFGGPGSAVERFTAGVTFDGTWDYGRFFDAKTPNDSKLHFNSFFQFRGGWRLGASLLVESFKYPEELYLDYAIEQRLPGGGLDTIPFVGTNRLFNLDLVANVSTPRFQNVSASALVVIGRDENFYEWASANILIATLSMDWRPTQQLRFNLLYNHQQYFRPDDMTTVAIRRIPRIKAEYQVTRAVFLRVVTQYDASLTDALHDDSRTEDPILVRDPASGMLVPTVRTTRNDVQFDWLFSFQPNPGTVFFAGYGTTMAEPNAFRFTDLSRTHDGFFVKLSYLFRM